MARGHYGPFVGRALMRIVFPAPGLSSLQSSLLERRDVETCAIAFANSVGDRLLVAAINFPPEAAYLTRTQISAVIRPEYLFDLVSRAKCEGYSLLFIHSHPFDLEVPEFSHVDDLGEARLSSYLTDRLGDRQHAAIVVSPGGLAARQLGVGERAVVSEVGRVTSIPNWAEGSEAGEQFDRQIRAFGYDGQAKIAAIKVGIVGAGGTGSITGQQLAHLGVADFTIIDFDTIEETNLNRLVGSTPNDVGQSKISIARRTILAAQPDASVDTICGDVADYAVAEALKRCDFIFCCTDSHASRAIVGQLTYQYLIPTIDMGVSLSVRGGQLSHITGRVQLLAPGLPCLTCMELLDSEQIRRELLTPEARANDHYIIGHREPQPSVVSINGTVASLALTMFIGVVTGAPVEARLQIYDGLNGTLRPMAGRHDADCYVCSPTGALARGDSWPLPTRGRK